MKRRQMIQAAAGVAAATALPAAIGAEALKDKLLPGGHSTQAAAQDAHAETYKGRSIRVSEPEGDHQVVYIDDRPLHVMKLGEGAYLSSLCHYGLEKSPLAAARRAVDELRGANLLTTPSPAGTAAVHHHSA